MNLAQLFLSSLLLDALKLSKQLCCIILIITAKIQQLIHQQNENSNLMSSSSELTGLKYILQSSRIFQYRANGGVCNQFPLRKTVNLHVEKRQYPDTSTVRKLWNGNYLSSESLLASASESSASMFFTGILSSASRFDPAEAGFQTTRIKNLYRSFLSFPILPTKVLRKAQIDTF